MRIPSYSSTLRLIAEFGARRRDVAGDRVVHLAQHVKLLLVATKTLNNTVSQLGDTTGDRRQARRRCLHAESLVGQRSTDRGDDLVDRVRPRVGHPVALPLRCRGQLGGDHTVDEVVDVHHRSALLTIADDGEPAGANEAEERRLARRLERPVEPRRAHDRRVEPAVDRVEHGQLGLHLRLAVAVVRVVRLVGPERVAVVRVGAERAVRRDVHQPAHPVIEGCFGDVARAVGVDLEELPRGGRVDDSGSVDHVGIAAGVVQQAGHRVGFGDVADDDLDSAERLERRAPRPWCGQATATSDAPRLPAAGAPRRDRATRMPR